jgi:hypothetical protein
MRNDYNAWSEEELAKVRASSVLDDARHARRAFSYNTWNDAIYASYGYDCGAYRVATDAATIAWYGAIDWDYEVTGDADFDAAGSLAWDAAITAVESMDAKKAKEA